MKRKIGQSPVQQSTRSKLCERGHRIGYNTAMPTVIFMTLEGWVWSIDQSGTCVNHGSATQFIAAVKAGEYRITLTDKELVHD